VQQLVNPLRRPSSQSRQDNRISVGEAFRTGVNMDSVMAMAASGMAAASASLTASASSIASMETTGPVPAGGATAVTSSALPSYTLAYDPSAPFANLQGMVAAPNVDPVAQSVNLISASVAFRANLAVLEAADKDFKTLLDTLA
jgi:flagellar basal-body rod protein FlgC